MAYTIAEPVAWWYLVNAKANNHYFVGVVLESDTAKKLQRYVVRLGEGRMDYKGVKDDNAGKAAEHWEYPDDRCPVPARSPANAYAEAVVHDKMNKGYTVIESGLPHASFTPPERPTNAVMRNFDRSIENWPTWWFFNLTGVPRPKGAIPIWDGRVDPPNRKKKFFGNKSKKEPAEPEKEQPKVNGLTNTDGETQDGDDLEDMVEKAKKKAKNKKAKQSQGEEVQDASRPVIQIGKYKVYR